MDQRSRPIQCQDRPLAKIACAAAVARLVMAVAYLLVSKPESVSVSVYVRRNWWCTREKRGVDVC